MTCQIVLSISADFRANFIKLDDIRLSTDDLRIAYLWSFSVDSKGHLFFLDARGCQLLVFNNRGQFDNRIGRRGQGPGEYMVPRTAYIDTQDKIYVLDNQTRRINVFENSGEFIRSFILTNSHGPGEILTDSQENVFLGGLSLPAHQGGRGDWLQKYDNQGRFIRSFFKDISGKNWVLRMNPNFIFDIYKDAIYAMQINRYDIQVFNCDGDLINGFNHSPKYFQPPDEKYVLDEKKFPSLDKLKNELYRLMDSWTRPIKIEVVNEGIILVQSMANGLIKGCSTKYVIDIWTIQGDLLIEAIPCDYQLLCSDEEGNCYFLVSTNQDEPIEKDPEYIIRKYRFIAPKK